MRPLSVPKTFPAAVVSGSSSSVMCRSSTSPPRRSTRPWQARSARQVLPQARPAAAGHARALGGHHADPLRLTTVRSVQVRAQAAPGQPRLAAAHPRHGPARSGADAHQLLQQRRHRPSGLHRLRRRRLGCLPARAAAGPAGGRYSCNWRCRAGVLQVQITWCATRAADSARLPARRANPSRWTAVRNAFFQGRSEPIE